MNNLILVVDDSPDTLGMLNDALESADMMTLVALDGKQAIKIATKMKPDIILLDAMMPQMDGFETCRRIKANANISSIPIIFMTGLSDTQSVVKGFEVGGVDYLTKPIIPSELIARMRVHLANARQTFRAHEALSTIGQNVFTIDESGSIQWSTPLVSSLLEKFSPAQKCFFAGELKNWVSHNPVKHSHIQVDIEGTAVHVVYVGLSDTSEHLLRLRTEHQLGDDEVIASSFNVTKRESQVLSWISKGKTNREIALILDMSPRTVNKHLEQIFKKIEVDNRTSAARKAIEVLQSARDL